MNKKIALFLVLFSISISLVAAQNNPGHDSLYILRNGDNISGIFNFTGSVLVPTPIDGSAAATKDYVDAQVATSGDVSGSGTTGQLTYWVGGSEISGSNSLFWNTIENRLGIRTITPEYTLDVNGSARFTEEVFVPTPSAIGHAATKGYVDAQVSGSGNGSVTEINTGLGLTGGPITTTGTISFNESYGDARYLRLTGGTLIGPLNMGNNVISNISTPVAGSDAATKDYVDTQVSTGGTNFNISGDTGSSAVGNADTVTIAGGTGITTSESGRIVTINVDDDYVTYTGATQNLNFNQRNISNFHIIQGHNSSYGIANNGTATIIGYIGDLT
jgi:hypothetical protein